jgi:hypothetical protein
MSIGQPFVLGGRLGHELLSKIIHFVLILQSTLDPGSRIVAVQ